MTMSDNEPAVTYVEGLLRRRYSYRDAVTGQWVTKEYAKANPSTTVRERVR